MVFSVKGLKTYDGFYICADIDTMNNGTKTVRFGPFYEDESYLIENFYGMLSRAQLTGNSLTSMPEYKSWRDCSSTVKNFTNVARRIKMKEHLDEYGVGRTDTVVAVYVRYKCGEHESIVEVDTKSHSGLEIQYNV